MYFKQFSCSFACLMLASLVESEVWPYSRYLPKEANNGRLVADVTQPEFEKKAPDLFSKWLEETIQKYPSDELHGIFENDSLPRGLKSSEQLLDRLQIPDDCTIHQHLPAAPQHAAAHLFDHLPYPLDPRCTVDSDRWWYRTYDGSCNWLEINDIGEGQMGTAKARDYGQHQYADGISKPRDGPNARAVSNAFFKRKKSIFYEHTPFLLGLIEFIIHDISYSQDSTSEIIEVPMPDDEEHFALNTTFKVWRTAAMPGTGTDASNPRENVNMATTWLDVSSLYGSTAEVARDLRSFSQGKLLTQELQTRGSKRKQSYLPFNTLNLPMRTRPGVDQSDLFAGGDPRTNEDWVMLGVHTLLLREHNRLCDILAKQHPEYEDEQLYHTVRLVMSAKFALIANAYQMTYWTDKMPWPRDDGYPLYRQMYGANVLEINPAITYPWPLVTKAGKPMVVSAEMAIVYRFHEFIVPSIPIKDALNETLWEQNLFDTGFNAKGFIDAGLENVLRGMVSTHIPNFKSGVDEAFRSAGKYRGAPFDVVAWSIVHEREQGLPTFNTYFREYNKQDPAVVVPIRKTFEDFSADAETVAKLKQLYKTPDDVDLVVGVQLEEEMFPGTTVPKSALIISLFSLFGMGNSDRFSIGFAMMRCLLIDKPWDCRPSNALEDLLWKPQPRDGFPNMRMLDPIWMAELDFQAHGTNLLWRLVTENSDIKCLQKDPLFPQDPDTNPVLCALPKQSVDYGVILLTAVELASFYVKEYKYELIAGALLAVYLWVRSRAKSSLSMPPVMRGWPVVGEALSFQKDPKSILNSGLVNFTGKVFGIKLASLTHFVLTKPDDLRVIKEDDQFEARFSLHDFLAAINFAIITKDINFESDLHTKLIRFHLEDGRTLESFARTIDQATEMYLDKHPLIPQKEMSQEYDDLSPTLLDMVTYVMSRCMVGPEVFDNPRLLETFKAFNDHAVQAMGLSSLLPSWLQFLAKSSIEKDFKAIEEILLPVIKERKALDPCKKGVRNAEFPDFLNFILSAVDDETRAADLVGICVWGGLTNLQATFSSTLLDILSTPNCQEPLLASLRDTNLSNLPVLDPPTTGRPSPWSHLRSAAFESLRLSTPITGPARKIVSSTPLASDPRRVLPAGQVATLSSYHIHRQPWAWGPSAVSYDPRRFLNEDPPIGDVNYVTWGLQGPHTCPGRWFALMAIQIMVRGMLMRYRFDLVGQPLSDDERYLYTAGNVKRAPMKFMAVRR